MRKELITRKNWQLLVANKRWGGDAPKPFAGSYPTRWIVSLVDFRERDHDGRLTFKSIWRYHGKPSVWIFRRILKSRTVMNRRVNLYEYDAGGIVRYFEIICPFMEPMGAQYMHPGCARFYYPFEDMNYLMWAKQPFRKRLVTKKHAATVYSPVKIMLTDEYMEALRGHRRWLRQGIWKPKLLI